MATVAVTELHGLDLLHRGKVRDLYAIPGKDDIMLMVATDRISAFDVVMDEPIPGKGEVLTGMSLFWFDYLKDVSSNHLVSADVDAYPDVCIPHRELLRDRSMLVRRLRPLPVECIVRGYIAGSCWQEYRRVGSVGGIALPSGMRESERFQAPLFTPSTKAVMGEHDENISIADMETLVGRELTAAVQKTCLGLYTKAASHALGRGIIIADTKFELGLDGDGGLVLIDEVLTPDSSRFWPVDGYVPGRGQESFDKQFVRDYLLTLNWDKTPPPPRLPADIIEKTSARYREALRRLTL